MGKLVSPVAITGLRLYTLVTKRPRVRVMVENENGEILLILGVLSRGNFWTFPGGGVNRGESLEAAAQRELLEETGIDRPLSAFRFVRLIQKGEFGLSFNAPIFHVRARASDLPRKLHNPHEVAAIGWFKRSALPERTVVFVRSVISHEK
jgi:8-oxo-dGTP pyrophosphatase MutT (NUDIX family)